MTPFNHLAQSVKAADHSPATFQWDSFLASQPQLQATEMWSLMLRDNSPPETLGNDDGQQQHSIDLQQQSKVIQ